MDPKAAAKSKRSHTVHGRRAHQTPAAAAAHRQKRAATSSGPRSRNLPSNWDRYDVEGEAQDPGATAGSTGEVAPRSKGSDFEFLLEQTRAQPRETWGLGSPWFPSQDSPFDFMQASTSMLEAKGEQILTWCTDDNFILEDELAPDFEVPFFSMDLRALANQLSKHKLSKRLFIEEDLIPEYMAVASEDNQIMIECDSSLGSDTKDSSVRHNLKNVEPRKDASHHEYASDIPSNDQTIECQSECLDQKTTTLPKNSTQLMHSDGDEDKRYTRIMVTDPGTSHIKELNSEMGAAEELDMLLNSLSGTHLSSSNLNESFGHDSNFQGMQISGSNEKVTPSMPSKPPGLAPLDDALDDLLSETCLSVQNEQCSTHVTTSIDDSVDDLLQDTLLCLNEQKQATSTQGQNNTSNDGVPLYSGPSKVSDDFDSWFDSL